MPQARLTDEAYELITRIARETGLTHQQVIERAVRLYEREQFFSEFEADFERVAADQNSWSELEAERSEWDATLLDGSSE